MYWFLPVKSKLSPLSGSVALKQLNPIHKRGHKFYLSILEVPHERIKVGIDTIFICHFLIHLMIEIFFENEGTAEQSDFDFEMEVTTPAA